MKDLPIANIRTDGGTQTRAELDADTIESYSSAMADGDEFPPVIVFYDGKEHWLADGFHRLKARESRGVKSIRCDVRQGTRRDAILFSVGANTSHGLRRTNADKRRSVETLLSDAEWGKWSDNEIAKRCGVSQPFVGTLRTESSYNGCKTDRTFVRGGTTATMKTENICKRYEELSGEEKDQAASLRRMAADAMDPLLAKHRAAAELDDAEDETTNPDEVDLPVLARSIIKHTDKPAPKTFTLVFTNDPAAVAATLAGRFDNSFLSRLMAELGRFTSAGKVVA